MDRSSLKKTAVNAARTALARGMQLPVLRAATERLTRECDRALTESGMYGGSYFGRDRNPLDRLGLSGYERYDRDTSNANAIALPVWKYFSQVHTDEPVTKSNAPVKSLDVGCAHGFVVEALCELGFDASGTDLSYWAVEHPAVGAKGRLQQGDILRGLPYADGEFGVVTCLELLEHLPPTQIGRVLREIRRVCGGYVVATIPSFGRNDFGPGGWFDGKVRPELLATYRNKNDGYAGPIPYDDLARDARGEPVEGHLTIASFAWWTRQFTAAGFARCGNTELLFHTDLAKYAQTEYWNVYVFRIPDVPEVTSAVHADDEVAHWEHNFKLDTRIPREGDYIRLNEALISNGREPVATPNNAIPTW